MSTDIGKNIRELRQRKRVSQEKLAEHLGVSFQAVSKWENGLTLPEVTLFPVIADYFGVSTDALFGMDALARDRAIEAICGEAAGLRDRDPARAEAILREALTRYPGDELLLNNLIYTMRAPERREEVIRLCRTLAENSTRYDDARYDAWRIMAETYAELGEQALAREAVEHIPEIYFTKLEVAANTLEGPEALDAARRQRNLSANSLLEMLRRLAHHCRAAGDEAAAAEAERLLRALLEVVGELPWAFGEGTLAQRYGGGA